jgi:hypothetical protein
MINRHPDGRLMMFDNWTTLWESADNGNVWTRVNIGRDYVSGQVRSFRIDAQGTMYFGCTDSKLAVVDPTTLQGSIHDYYEYYGGSQWVGNITFANNDVYYLCNLNPAKGIYSRNNNWSKLAMPDFGEPIRYFFPRNNGKFIVASGLWMYTQE